MNGDSFDDTPQRPFGQTDPMSITPVSDDRMKTKKQFRRRVVNDQVKLFIEEVENIEDEVKKLRKDLKAM